MGMLLAWTLLICAEFLLFLVQGPSCSAMQKLQVLWGAFFLLAPFLAVALPLSLLSRRGSVGLWLAAGTLALLLCLLNLEALQRGYVWLPAASAAAVLIPTWLALLARRTSLLEGLFVLSSLSALPISAAIGRDLYPGRYLAQHLSLSLLTVWVLFLALGFLLRGLSGQTRHRITLALACLWSAAAGLFLLLLNGRMDPAAATFLTSDMATTRSVFGLVAPLSDKDRDGYGTLLSTSDCDDSRREVSPAQPEIPANGLDDNCLGGDAPSIQERGPAASLDGPPPTTVLLLTIDALRPDCIWGPHADRIAPRLQALSRRCVRYRNAWSTYASTLQSVFSIFWSRLPSQAEAVKACAWFEAPYHSDAGLIARLAEGGWQTAAAVGSWLLAPECFMTREFHEVLVDPDGLGEQPRAHELAELATRALPRTLPRFLWVHFMDPHAPYVSGHHNPGTLVGSGLERGYYSEVRHVDDQLGALFALLPQDAVIIVAGDHGERLSPGTTLGHLGLDEDSLRVPLLVCDPSLEQRDEDAVVSLLDLAPTIADLARLPLPATWRGQSLIRPLLGLERYRGWAAAEFFEPARDRSLRRLLVTSSDRIEADLGLHLFTITDSNGRRVSKTLRTSSAASAAYLDLAERLIAIWPGEGSP